MLSTYFTGRDANRGDCAHPCRYAYTVVEEKRPGQHFPVEEDERGTYIFNSKDLCLLQHLPLLVDAGVHSVKIEGRMKSAGYVGAVVRLYRLALNWIGEQIFSGQSAVSLILPQSFRNELSKIGTRGQTENFFSARPSSDDMLYDRMRIEQVWVPVGIVRQAHPLMIETRHVLTVGDQVEHLGRTIEPDLVAVTAMTLADGTLITRANPGTTVRLHTEPSLHQVEKNALLRKRIEPS
jgi:putative protease